MRTDYNHQVNFSQYHTYCWGKVQTTDPFFASRIHKQLINSSSRRDGN